MRDIAAVVEAVLLPHPGIAAVELVGSRADGSATRLSDWDFVVVTDRFDEVARALPTLVAGLDALAQQWDRISAYPCYMLPLRGDRGRRRRGPGSPRRRTPNPDPGTA